jgi:hypothetical protein
MHQALISQTVADTVKLRATSVDSYVFGRDALDGVLT